MRLAYVARYVPTKVRVYRAALAADGKVVEHGGTLSLAQYGTVLVSGKDEFGHNKMRESTTRGQRFSVVDPR